MARRSRRTRRGKQANSVARRLVHGGAPGGVRAERGGTAGSAVSGAPGRTGGRSQHGGGGLGPSAVSAAGAAPDRARVVRPGPRVGVHGKRRGGAARGALPPGPTGGPAVPAAPAATASHLSRVRERRALSDQRLPEGPVTSVRLLEDASRRLTHARGALRRLLPRRPAASGGELSPLDGDGTDAPRHPRPRPGAPHAHSVRAHSRGVPSGHRRFPPGPARVQHRPHGGGPRSARTPLERRHAGLRARRDRRATGVPSGAARRQAPLRNGGPALESRGARAAGAIARTGDHGPTGPRSAHRLQERRVTCQPARTLPSPLTVFDRAFLNMPAGQPVPSAGRAATEPRALRWGALQIALAIVVLLQVWRIHDLFPVLAVHGVPILATVTAVALFALSNDVWRRVSSLNHPIVRAALGIVLLVALSVPGSLYPGASASFLLKDYLRSVILMVLAAATVFLMVALGKTGSRGGFLGLVTVGGYLLLRLRGVSTLQRVATVALLAILLSTLASDKYFERMGTMLHLSQDYNWCGKSETGRLAIWRRGLGYMIDHPFLGVGAAAFPVAEGTLAPEAQEQRRYGRGFKWSAAHNSFVQIGAELGVGGLVLFVALLAAAFRTLGRLRRAPAARIGGIAQIFTARLVAFVVTACVLVPAYSAYLYTLLGMILGLARIVWLAT